MERRVGVEVASAAARDAAAAAAALAGRFRASPHPSEGTRCSKRLPPAIFYKDTPRKQAGSTRSSELSLLDFGAARQRFEATAASSDMSSFPRAPNSASRQAFKNQKILETAQGCTLRHPPVVGFKTRGERRSVNASAPLNTLHHQIPPVCAVGFNICVILCAQLFLNL